MNAMGLTIIAVAVIAQSSVNTPPEGYWRNPLRCGPNCLHVYLKLHGVESSLDIVASRVKIGPSGAALHDLGKAATDLGVPSMVVKVADSDLNQIPLPAIAHLHVKGGHYCLLLRMSPDSVTTADMTSGRVEEMPRDSFLEMWSGFLLIPGRPSSWKRPVLFSTALIVGLISLYCWRSKH